MKKSSVIVLGAFLLAMAGYLFYSYRLAGPSVVGPLGPVLEFPAEWEGLKRISMTAGEGALTEFKKLHGKSLPVVGGYKVDYANPSEKIILWVAVTQKPADADKLVQKMSEKISENAGTSREMFSRPTATPLGGLKIYFTRGAGMNNYYYARQNLVYWVGISSPREGELMKTIAEGGM